MTTIVPVILAGGSGSRLWPLSRAEHPKQFHSLVTNEPLLIDAARRLPAGPPYTAPLIVTGEQSRFAVAAAFRNAKLDHCGIILEPEGRSTAPAAAVASLIALRDSGPGAFVLIMPSDHHIERPEAFLEAVETGTVAAEKGNLVLFGVTPTQPETGYGYIQPGPALDNGVFQVRAFIEKPNRETASALCASGTHYWNAGIFLFHAQTFLDELGRLDPGMTDCCTEAANSAASDMGFIRLGDSFRNCRSDSIDYAVMEKTARAAIVPLDAGWSDAGTWDALFDTAAKDGNGNATHGDVVLQNAHGCYVRAGYGMVAVSGVDDVIVVSTKDATLVTKRGSSGGVKEVVKQLSDGNRAEARHHLVVHRPWGCYETLHLSERYQVKQIVVEPGASLSLQRHHHRAEHWIVVKGTARITVDSDVRLLTENQSIYVPLGAVHRLENPGLIPLTLIEVQSGPYLGEDDIVRLEDIYARA